MKLISCYIEAYGAIHQQSFYFDSTLTSLLRENGYGKTTIASFLEAMFYGLDPYRANTKEFVDRLHFNPFQGGKFGGNVTFSMGDDIYKIERFFDEKSDTRDKLTVYHNGKPAPDFDRNIGERIFEIDKQSFERTIFINANEIEISSTSSINNKLNNLIEGSNDDTNLDDALMRLEKKAKEYKKAKSGIDLISEEQNTLISLQQKIANIESIQDALSEKYQRSKQLKENADSTQKQIAEAQQVQLALKDWEQYDSLQKSAREAKEKAAVIFSNYPFGIPKEKEISTVNDAITKYDTLIGNVGNYFSEEDERRLNELTEILHEEVPDDVALNHCDEQILACAQLNANLNALQNVQQTDRERALRQRFFAKMPDEKTLSALETASEKYAEADKAARELPEFIINALPTGQTPKSKSYLIGVIIAAVLMLTGIAVVFLQLVAGLLLLAVGFIGLAVTGFLFLNKKTSSPMSSVQQIPNPERQTYEVAKNNAQKEISQILTTYDYSLDGGVHYVIQSFKDDVKTYTDLLQTDEIIRKKIETQQRELNEKQQSLNQFFAYFQINTGDLSEKMKALRSFIDKYNSLLLMKQNAQKHADNTKADLATELEQIKRFCNRYHYTQEELKDILNKIRQDSNDYFMAKSAYHQNAEAAEKFKIEKGLSERPDDRLIRNISDLNEQHKELNKSIISLDKEISEIETEAEKLDELKEEYRLHEEKLKEYKYNHKLLTAAMQLLSEADSRLKDKYIAPIKNKFLQYTALLEEALGNKIMMTPNFEIRYERNGQERSEKYFSAGQRSICAFCFRMALIDNMYQKEKPFLILDDPFVNLDKDHFSKVKNIINKISQNLQIIYFTCHDSRAL